MAKGLATAVKMRSHDCALVMLLLEPMMHTEVQFSFSPIYTRIGDQKTWVRVLIFKRFNDNQKIVWCTFFCDFINRSYLRSKVWSEKSSKNENDTKFSAHQSVLSILKFWYLFLEACQSAQTSFWTQAVGSSCKISTIKACGYFVVVDGGLLALSSLSL